jgi:hypothetical protein
VGHPQVDGTTTTDEATGTMIEIAEKTPTGNSSHHALLLRSCATLAPSARW